jgi:hypothetical protein
VTATTQARSAEGADMKPLPLVLALTIALAATGLLTGCGGKSTPNSPEAVAQAFADAMAAKETGRAADLWNYITDARKSNPDWDEIPSGQRGQIISKLEDAKQGELQPQVEYFTTGMEAGPANVSGTSATVQLQGGSQRAVVVRLEQADGQWGVVGFGPADTR